MSNPVSRGKYIIAPEMIQRLENTFTYHAPKEDQPQRYVAIRDKAKELAAFICGNTPVSKEQSFALIKLEEAMFWANASIARNE